MNYSLSYQKHKTLINKILQGKVSLFTGAGFSLGAKIRGDNILSTNALLENLLLDLMEFSTEEVDRIIKKKSFQEICQMCVAKVTEEEFNNYLVRKFKNCIPADFHYSYASVPWKEIYTLNIDDIIETIYKETDIEPQVYNTRIKPMDYSGNNILKYYKLHGDVNNKTEGFVFSSVQYVNKLTFSENLYNYTKFAENIYYDTMCLIGTSLSETDLEAYIQRFRKSFGGQLPQEKLYYISRTIYPEDVITLSNRNIICIEETAESFIEKLLIYAKEQNIEINSNTKESPLRIVKKVSFDTKMKNLGFIEQKGIQESLKNHSTYKAIDYYTGFEPTWNDIINESDALLINTEELINNINDNDSFRVFLLLGKAGNGKTTSLKRVIYNFSENTDYIVLSYDEVTYIDETYALKIAKELKKVKEKILLTFDNGAWAFNFISYLYRNNIYINLSIIVTSRIPEYYREMRNLQNISTTIINFDEVICRENAKRIINKLEQHSYIGDLARFTKMDERIDSFIKLKNSYQDLFSCLIQSVEGDGHYNKLEEVIKQNMNKKENALFLIVLTIFDSFGTFSLSLQIFLNIFQDDITDLKKIIYECSDLLNQTDIKDYKSLDKNIKPRGSFVSDKILESYSSYFSHNDILEISKKILIFVSTNYDTQFKKGKNFYTEITHSLLVSKRYQKTFMIKDRNKFNSFYHSLIHYFNENSDFWLQYAKMEMKLGDLKSAKIHLEQASSLSPHSIKIKHAIGQWYMFKSLTYKDFGDAEKDFETGEKIMIGQRYSNDAYPIHSLIDGFMQLHKRYKFKLEKKKIQEYYKLITDSLAKMNNHSLLLLIWKKYYVFLERNNIASFVRLSLDDRKIMSKINLNKDADEQYLLYKK